MIATESPASAVKALIFDVFGTVVDWRGSIAAQAAALTEQSNLAHADWDQFARDWRSLYQPSMAPIRNGQEDYVPLDTLHRRNLDQIAERYGLAALGEEVLAEVVLFWHRLTPWPDSVDGLIRLKQRYIIGPHSNGNIALMVNMAKNAGLPWDVILGADIARQYKPQPETYLRCCEVLGLRPEQVMMVAAHNGDLRAARTCGLACAFVARPLEYGPDQSGDFEAEEDWEVVAGDFGELANRLGC